MRKLIAGAALALIVSGAGGTAFAGERGGNGEQTPINQYRANSICSFSGLDDMDFEAPVDPGVVQSFGQVVKQIGPIRGVPGHHCNGHFDGLHG